MAMSMVGNFDSLGFNQDEETILEQDFMKLHGGPLKN
jgi:hypothetical protein